MLEKQIFLRYARESILRACIYKSMEKEPRHVMAALNTAHDMLNIYRNIISK